MINLHKELNTKKNSYDDFSFEDYTEKTAYRQFKINFNSQNDSIISKLFFSEIKTISMCHKCKILKYTYDICKYLYFDIKNQNKVSLNYLLKDFENGTTKVKDFCRICVEDNLDISENQKLNLFSEILIFVLNNEHNAKIEFKLKETLNNNNYNLISCISKSKIENNFNVLFPSNQKWYQFQNNFNENEIGNNLGILISNPFVLFYEKVYDNNSILCQMNDSQANINQENTLESIEQNTLKREQNKIMNKMKELMKKGNQIDNQMNNQIINSQMNNQIYNQMNNMQINNQMYNQMNNMQINNQMYNQMNNMQTNNKINNNFNQYNYINYNMNQINMRNNNNMNFNSQYNPLLNSTNKFLMNNNLNMPINNFIANNANNMSNSMKNYNYNNYFNNNNNVGDMNVNIRNNNNMMPNNFNNYNNMNNNIINQQMNNNILNNNNYLDNNNNQKNNNNNPNNIILEDKNENEFITIYFMLSNQKQLYFDVKSTSYFKDVIRDLRECFTWLNYIQIIDYKYNGKSVDPNKTLEENLIKDSSVINIINY